MTTVKPAPIPAEDLAAEIRRQLDAVIDELHAGEARWLASDLASREKLLASVSTTVSVAAERWVQAATRVKRLDRDSQLVGEEWITGPYPVLTGLGALRHSLAHLSAGESPLTGVQFGSAPGGRISVPILPNSAYEALLLHGFSGEVWMPPGTTEEDIRSGAGLAQRDPTKSAGVGLVLGAGNITSIPPLDVLYELIANNRVVVLKLNPVMDDLLSVYSEALSPLIEYGVLRIVTGGSEVGSYLVNHPGIAHVHMTGSAATHDAIVFGSGQNGRERKAKGTPTLTKPISSELGGVSPIIVVPGKWTKRDLRYQAEHLATQRLHNGGYNCIAGQVIVLSKAWPQKDAFLKELRRAVATAPSRPAWYPGSDDRIASAKKAYPQAQHLGVNGERLLIEVGTNDDPATLETTEFFSPVLGVVTLPDTGQAFLDAAVELANNDFVGTLGANIIADPRTLKSLGRGFDSAIERLRYGTIAINAWTGLGYLTATAPWGAFPGHTLADIQSGTGVVHNGLLIDSPERTVVRGPFRPFPRSVLHGEFALFPKPPWFVSARSAATTARLLTEFATKPSWRRMPGVFAAAFRA